MCFFLNWLVSEQLAKSACASISKRPGASVTSHLSSPFQHLAAQPGAGGAGCLS